MNKLTLEVDGASVIVTRKFNALPEAVYRAHTEAALIRQWMQGPDGWEIVTCTCDAKAGGSLHYEWSNAQGHGFSLTGEFIELTPFARIEHVERMHLPDATPDNHIVTTFTEKDGGTLMEMRMTLPDEATRKAMLESGMEHGMEASFARLDSLEMP